MTVVLVVAGVTALVVACAFLFAPWRASQSNDGYVRILGGFALYVLWKPEQAILISRRGRVLPVLGTDKQGGSTFIFPLFGDRIEDRCDLRLTSFNWSFSVLTRESIPCTVNVDVWWKVANVTTFLAAAGTSKRLNEENPAVSVLGTTEFRLKSLTDSLVSSLVAQTSLLQFLTSIKTEYEKDERIVPPSSNNLATLSQTVATSLTNSLSSQTEKYGIEIDRVEVPGVRFAPEIEKNLMDTWLAHLKPVRAKQEAAAAKFDDDRKLSALEREKEILGRQAVGTREIVKHMPESKGLTLNDPVMSVLSVADRLGNHQAGNGAVTNLPMTPAEGTIPSTPPE